eukprot:5062918-Amphidinium_carterae.1
MGLNAWLQEERKALFNKETKRVKSLIHPVCVDANARSKLTILVKSLVIVVYGLLRSVNFMAALSSSTMVGSPLGSSVVKMFYEFHLLP